MLITTVINVIKNSIKTYRKPINIHVSDVVGTYKEMHFSLEKVNSLWIFVISYIGRKQCLIHVGMDYCFEQNA